MNSMEKNLLIGNGINIQFGGKEIYSGKAIMNRIIDNILENSKSVCHLHGEFDVLSPEYDDKSIYYKSNKSECDELIKNRVVGMDHIYSNAVMSWYWLDKYGKMMEDLHRHRCWDKCRCK